MLPGSFPLVVSLPLLSCGCMTAVAQEAYWNREQEMVMVYSGTYFNVVAFVSQRGPFHDLTNAEEVGTVPGTLLHVLDLPLSLAADTLILPLTIGQTIRWLCSD